MAEQRSSRSKKAAAQPVAPIECPPHALYRNEDGPAWPNQPDIGLQQGDEARLQMILTEAEKKGHSMHPMFSGKNKLGRAVSVYKLLPQSYKNKIWKKAADHLIATHYDPLLAPDSKFLPSDITQPIWPGAEDCETACPTEQGWVCPWKDDCKTFYDIRKPRWDRQHEISQTCYTNWNLEEARRKVEDALERRRATLAEKKKELKRRWKAEQELSRTMFEPKQFSDEQENKDKIKAGIRENLGEPDPRFLAYAITEFAANAQKNGFTLLDFQCTIADYFHDGMPGFRISSTKDPKISGIRVHDINMIRIGKERHQYFMYLFLSNVLHMIRDRPSYRLERIRAELDQLESSIRYPLFTLPNASAANAVNVLDMWRDKLKLRGTRIEDSLIPNLSLPPDENAYVYHTSLSFVKGKNPIHSYHSYLQSGRRRITIHINKGEVNLLTKPEAQRVVTFLLLVLFGPSYETDLPTNPVQFTFDAHKGHMNRLLAISRLPGVLRLVTPYNIADSAMTEKFRDVDPDDEDLVAEIEEEEDVKKGVKASIRKIKEEIKKEAKIGEEEEEEEDDTHAAAQKGDKRFIYTFNKNPGAPPIIVSDTNMIFDDNWLIYYKNRGFTQQSPYLFSMNLVDAGLHQYITSSRDLKIKKIPSSFYTVEAPFSNEITRGPSLNYLMMGLMRGSKSDIFGAAKFNRDELYHNICDLYPIIYRNDDIMKGLLPIYTIPASSHSLPLFQYISKAPLFAYHMMYDLKHQLSALPSRIKWAGDREQYMAIQDVTNSAFVTLDTTGYYCALANRVPSILERKQSIKLVGFELDSTKKGEIATRAGQTPQQVPVPNPAGKGVQSKPVSKVAPSKVARSKHSASAIGKDAKSKPASKAPSRAPTLKVGVERKNSMKNGGNYTRKNVTQSIPQSMPGREYFFLNWLYPLTISVNGAFYDQHRAEHAYVLLQDLQKDLSYPLLFPALQEQLVHAVSQIPNVPKDLMDTVTTLTAETYDIVAPECLSRLETLYTSPNLSIFSQPAHKDTLLGYLGEMKEKLTRRLSDDSTTNMLHVLLAQDIVQGQEKACIALALLFERLHGRIQNGTSYLGQILGITGGPELECVDDQEAWEYLTDVLTEDMAWITDLSQQAVMPTKTSMQMEAATPTETPVVMPTVMPAETPAMMPSNPKMIRYSAKKHNVVRGPVYDKLKKDLRQLRSNRVRAMPMPTMQMAAAVAGGSLRKTRHATRRHAKTRHATRHANTRRRND